VAVRRFSLPRLWRLLNQVRRLGWGIADQAVSSVTNVAMVLFVAHTVGAEQFGAFSLAYVTYSFVLNASRGLASDPLMVRFSSTDHLTWRRAVASCTGTATVVGLAAGACVLAVAALLSSTARFAFLGLGLTLPVLMLQDSWRFSFFALGRGSQAFLNDLVWAVALIPTLIALRGAHVRNVFWFVFAWGAAAGVAAAAGLLQARVVPRLAGSAEWLSHHRDLGSRYLAENVTNGGASQLRTYGLGFIVGLAGVGYVQAASTLMGPVMVVFMGMSMVGIPEAARILNRSPHRLRLFCLLVSGGLAIGAAAWGAVLLVALPKGLGAVLLGPIWRPTYPLILPYTLAVVGVCAWCGATAGLHALGAARRSLRAMVLASIASLVGSLAGALAGGTVGSVQGFAAATWFGTLLWWWHLHAAMRESGILSVGGRRAGHDGEPAVEEHAGQPEPAREPGSDPASAVSARPDPGAPPGSLMAPASTAWSVVVSSDQGYYDRTWAMSAVTGISLAFPAYRNERRFRLTGTKMRIGRRSATRGLQPDIDLAGPPADPGISRSHATLIAAPDGTWSVLDQGSANGTLLNGRKVAVGDAVPLHDGDRINLGAWTVITVHHGQEG
jgi:O-antigen/teichoic acid export membrane protein